MVFPQVFLVKFFNDFLSFGVSKQTQFQPLALSHTHSLSLLFLKVVTCRRVMASRRTKVVIIFYSLYTHTWQLAQAIADGASEVEGVDVEMYQVPELLPPEVVNKMGYAPTHDKIRVIIIMLSYCFGRGEKLSNCVKY